MACCRGHGSKDELWEHFVGEFMMIFLLVFTRLETAVNSVFDYSSMAYFAIGLTVFLSYRCYANAWLGEFTMTFSRSGCRNVDHWTQEGHLPGHVGLLGRTIGQHCSGSWWIHDVRSLSWRLLQRIFV